jgi:hypothetical protein
MLAITLGILTLLRPIPRIRINSRRRALALLASGIGLLTISILLPARFTASNSTVLAQFIPDYQFNEFHQVHIDAPCDRVYSAVKQVTPSEIKFYSLLTWIRRFGRQGRVSILNPDQNKPLLDSTKSTFVILSDDAHEIVLGTIIRAPADFRPRQHLDLGIKGLRQPGFIVAAINFTMQPQELGHCSLATETRIFATDRISKLRFAIYWRAIYPGSALIRIYWLKAIKVRAEKLT